MNESELGLLSQEDLQKIQKGLETHRAIEASLTPAELEIINRGSECFQLVSENLHDSKGLEQTDPELEEQAMSIVAEKFPEYEEILSKYDAKFEQPDSLDNTKK